MYRSPMATNDAHTQDDAEWLRAKLISLLGHLLSVEDVWTAMGINRSTYYNQARAGQLLNLSNLKSVARNLGVNEVQLLLECGLIDTREMQRYLEVIAEGTESGPTLGIHPLAGTSNNNRDEDPHAGDL